ncbi:MAG TPA: carboxypeptidase regulatory-like domain-containing protein [Bryobacteraceae bacterium]|jgi:outer membrane receptor protein involved in Fe transport
MRNRSLGLVALILFGLFSVSSFGQAVTATLLGTVTDVTGAVIGNAKVTATESTTGVARTTETNVSGNFSFPELPPGTYNVSVELTGFKRETRSNIGLLVNSTVRVDVALQPGNVSESVEVTGAPPALQTERADTGRNIDQVVTEAMPLSTNRNYETLLNLVPGTTKATFQHSQFFNASDSLQTEVNGQPRQQNNYQIEGIDDNERTGLLQVLIPPIEAIQSVDVSTSNHEAELGRGGGAVTNVILKSGSNQIHGSAYEFLQNSAFDARSFFSQSVGHKAYNYFGGTIGGPIKKNKLFFFADYLRVADHEANNNVVTVPSAKARTGDLSEATSKVYDPTTGAQDGSGVGRTQFPGNIIPADRLNPISLKILALVPLPNLSFNPANPSNNYSALLPFHKDTDFTDGKIDYNVTDKDRVSGRFSFQHPVIFQAPLFGLAGGPGPGGAFMGTGIQKTYSTGINWSHIFTPTFLAELRVGVAHYHNAAQSTDYGTQATSALGIPGVNVSEFTSGLVSINGPFSNPMIGYAASLPWIRAEANIDLVNNWTKIWKNHTIKFGYDMRRLRDDLLQTQTFGPRGAYTFGSGQTGAPGDSNTTWANTMGSLLLDLPSSGGRDFSIVFPTFRAWQHFFYVQDKWQVSKRLTLDLGLRWEMYPPGVAAHAGEFSNYNPTNNTLVVAGVGGNPANLGLQNHLGYFAPRFGVAYRLSERTVIRTGFGISYTPYPDNSYAWDNYPVKGNAQLVPINGITGAYGPVGLSANGPVATFATGFPVPAPAVIPPNGIIDASQNIGGVTNLETGSWKYVPLDFKNPYVESYNFAVQQALGHSFTLDLAYVGNHGVRTLSQTNINAVNSVAGIACGPKCQPEYPRTATTTEFFQGFSSMYNSFQAKLDRRFASGFSLTTSFTLGRAMSYQTGDDGGLLYYINERRNYARADYDRAKTFVQSYVYELPFGKGKHMLTGRSADYVFGGWKLSGILTMMSGLPVNLTFSGTALNAPGNTNTPNQVGEFTVTHGINVGNPWFTTSSFVAPTCTAISAACPVGSPGFLGNVGRNSISGPGFFDLDLTLSKDYKIMEHYALQLRLETFNLTNTAQFANPNGTCCTGNFGVITGTLGSGSGTVNGTGGGRYLQLGAKFTF